MTNTREDLSLSHVELIVLSRLSAPNAPSEKTLATYLAELAPSKGAMAPTLTALRTRGLVSYERRVLTDAGARALRSAFGLARTPKWTEVRDVHLPALALGLPTAAERAGGVVGSLSAITAAVAATHIGSAAASSVNELCDALIAKELGLPPGPITLNDIRAHILARHGKVEPKGDPKEVALRIAESALRPHFAESSKKRDKKSLSRALVRRWVHGKGDSKISTHAAAPAPVLPLPPSNPQPSNSQPSSPLPHPNGSSANPSQSLLTVVRDAIPRVGADGRYGSEKVFVSAIWHSLERERRVTDWSLERFKNWLLAANRDGFLTLARADFVGALDAKQVAESEIRDQGATFHFVLDQRAGASGAGRAHAR